MLGLVVMRVGGWLRGACFFFVVFYFGKVVGRLAQYPFVVCFGCQRWGGKGEISVHSNSYPSKVTSPVCV